jgi:2-polyprenyl-3-methyl-5-hydroxy-6-metoxy-1,4-benzoquinol methylase
MKVNDIRPDSLLDGQNIAYLKDVDFYQQVQDEFLVRNCPGCQNGAESEFTNHHGFSFKKCSVCQSIFMNPGPTPELVYKFYENSHNYKYWSEYIYPLSRQARMETIHKQRSTFVLEALRQHLGSGKRSILEIGAGTGDTLACLKDQTNQEIDVHAIEWNPDMITQLRKNKINVIDKSIEKLSESMQKFDAVLLFEVAEHLLSPLTSFKSIYKLLKPGGLVLLSTPNAASIEVQFLRELSTTLDIEHISVLTPQAMVFLATMSNFRILEMKTEGNLDVDLLARAGCEIRLVKNEVSVNESDLQKIISESGFSSNMQVTLQKNY